MRLIVYSSDHDLLHPSDDGSIAERGWPERLVIALEQSLAGGTERSTYGEEADISPATASADFRRLLDAGLVEQRGRGRNISYAASESLRATAG